MFARTGVRTHVLEEERKEHAEAVRLWDLQGKTREQQAPV